MVPVVVKVLVRKVADKWADPECVDQVADQRVVAGAEDLVVEWAVPVAVECVDLAVVDPAAVAGIKVDRSKAEDLLRVKQKISRRMECGARVPAYRVVCLTGPVLIK